MIMETVSSFKDKYCRLTSKFFIYSLQKSNLIISEVCNTEIRLILYKM